MFLSGQIMIIEDGIAMNGSLKELFRSNVFFVLTSSIVDGIVMDSSVEKFFSTWTCFCPGRFCSGRYSR